MVNSYIKEIIVVNYKYLKRVYKLNVLHVEGGYTVESKQYAQKEVQLVDRMMLLVAMLEVIFEPTNDFQVAPKTVKINNRYLLTLTAYRDISDTKYRDHSDLKHCQAGIKLQVIRNYGKKPAYTVDFHKDQYLGLTDGYYTTHSFAHYKDGCMIGDSMRHTVPPLITYDVLEEILLSGNMNADMYEVLNQGLSELLKYLFSCYGLEYREG